MSLSERYEVLGQIYEGHTVIVYRGRSRQDGTRVILKMQKPEAAWTKLRDEHAIRQHLHLPGVVGSRDLEEHGSQSALVLEDLGGETLASRLARGPLPLAETLQIAIEVADTLGHIHHKRVIHKDINPSNVLLDESGHAKVFDFDLSTRLPREIQSVRTPNLLAGTLTYISPEQTGRMNRAIDYRTDLYSFGATFYQMLTGRVPFPTHDPIELVHCHIAMMATPPAELDTTIPQVVSDIVMKLLEKVAEARYQSAFGLKADLEECSRRLAQGGRVDPFPLGQRDVSDRFQISQNLYGREEDIAALEGAFARAEKGRPGLALVVGSSGIGKSSVIHELYKSLSRSRGYFISGKFDQLKRDIPYTALLEAFSELVRSLLAEQEGQFKLFRTRIQDAVGVAGRVLTELLPELDHIIGPQPPVPELPAVEARNRFRMIFESFLQVFTQHGQPLVLFLDDLQWADAATLDILPNVLDNSRTGALLVIGSYRDNEVSAGHPLLSTIATIEKESSSATRILLGPIGVNHVGLLIAETLSIPASEAQPLAELVWRRTDGNPLFVGELLTMLHKDGLFEFSPASNSWRFDLAKIERAPTTDNVGQLMAARAAALSESSQEILRFGAVLGSGFDLDKLALVAERSPEETRGDLEEALQDGLLFATRHGQRDVYRFIHDRVQQAVYASIPEAERVLVHHRTGQLLLRDRPRDDHDAWLFDMLHHLNLAAAQVQNPEHRTELARLNLAAAKKASAAGAFAAASNHYVAGITFLTEGAWTSDHELIFLLHLGRAECEYISNNEISADQRLAFLLKQETCTNLERAQAYVLLANHKLLLNKHIEAVDAGHKALDLVGFALPRKPGPSQLMLEFVKTRRKIRGRSPADLGKIPDATDPRVQLALRTLLVISGSSFMASVSSWMGVIFLNMQLSMEYGNTKYSGSGYISYGLIMNMLLGDYAAGEGWGRLAIELADRYQDKSHEAQMKFVYGFSIHPWRHFYKEGLRYEQEAVQAALQVGDFTYAGYPLGYVAVLQSLMGDRLDSVRQACEEHLELARRITHGWAENFARISLQSALALQGLTVDAGSFDTSDFDETAFVAKLKASNATNGELNYYWLFKLMGLYILERYDEALAISKAAQKTAAQALGIGVAVVDYHYYEALLLIALTEGKSDLARQRNLLSIRGRARKLKKWADSAPMNFRAKYLLVSAEIARLTNDDRVAVGCYEGAIVSAHEHELLHDEAVALELASKFHRSRGLPDVAMTYLGRARQAYVRWGAHAKVALLDQAYPGLAARGKGEGRSVRPLNAPAGSSNTTTKTLDVPSMIKASQALSGEISVDRLLRRLMQVVAENAGAERGVLVLQQQDTLAVVAEFTARGGARLPERPMPISESTSLSPGILAYVLRSRQAVVLNDAASEGSFVTDPYVLSRKPKAVLCAPLLQKAEVAGALYLENNLVSGAFTEEHAELLGVLCAQMAISIDNAYLYADLEQKVTERTRALREAQARLVLLEQEATENQMAGGFAHEMRNALAGAKLMLSRVFRSTGLEQPWSVSRDNSRRMGQLFLRLRDEVSTGALEDVSDILREMNDDEQLVDTVLQGVERSVDRGLGITRLILEYAQLARAQPGKDFVSARTLVDSILQDIELDCRTHQITVEVDVPAECMLIGNERHFYSILNNLVLNARDALIEVKDKDRRLSIRATEQATCIVLSVEDTGPGIPAELHEKIFEPFFSTKPTTGTGLGLGVIRKLTALYGGEIKMVTDPRQGTTFQAIIPKAPPRAALEAAGNR